MLIQCSRGDDLVKKMIFGVVLLLLVTILPNTTYAATTGKSGDCFWYYDDGVLTISGEGEMADYANGSDSAPWRRGTAIKRVVIKEGVTNIGSCAFSFCNIITDITIPSSVTKVGDNAFYTTANLSNVWYMGSEKEKNNILVGAKNEDFKEALWHYNSCIENEKHKYGAEYDDFCNVCGSKLKAGDLDKNDITNNKDLAILVQYINGWSVEIVNAAADVNNDRRINNKDYVFLMRYINKWDVKI